MIERLPGRFPLYARLVRIDRPIGILLLLWPTLWALWIAADGAPGVHLLLVFGLGTVLMRSAGCAINDYADRDFDGAVERTRQRPLATGALQAHEALAVAAVLSLIALLLVLSCNRLTVLLSIPAVFLAGSYPFTKRFFPCPQAYLGVAFGFGIPMAFAAVQGSVPAVAWWMLAANVLWSIAYDTEYAMVDRPDDIRLGIHSSALLFGRHDVLAVMLCYAGTLALLARAGWLAQLGWAWYLGLLLALGIAGYHGLLIRGRERSRCFRAFLHNNWLGAAVFGGLVLDRTLAHFSAP
ncbi:MAG: 4-hydroxybenzoate octaprenyltransferase [Pseudomonadota bacterium]|nr:4-hydroxybenzoate octaprenyltransferase [Pseudomonadota bacterium]